jgi:putative NADPH-quinone reductase
MKRITIIDGHPDPSEAHLNHALADKYVQQARASGNEVRRIDVGRIDFPLLRDPDEFYKGTPPEAIRNAQRDIAWAEHLVFFYPLWEGDMPALLKGFIEQTFRPGFSLDYGGERRFPKKLLTGKTARVIVTMGMPALIYRWFFAEHSLKSLKRSVLELCGITPVRETLIGSVGDTPHAEWLDLMTRLAEEDAASKPSRNGAWILGVSSLLFGAACLAYAARTRAR